MRTRKSKVLMLAVTAALTWNVAAMGREFHCAEDPHVIAACFDVHGRITVPANSRTELWQTGTKHVFGLQYPGDLPGVGGELTPLPRGVADILADDPSAEIFGDFTICPYTPAKLGEKQYACVEQARKLVKHYPRPRD